MTTTPTPAALERAIRDGEFVLHYQPKISLATGSVVGAEALVRWNVGATIVSPDDFLPLAEESGLLHDLTLGLLDQVLEATASISHASPGFAVSMNVAPDDLAANVISSRIGLALEQQSIEARNLQIEITESAVMSNVETVRDDLVRLEALGVKVLMDDFGTGYSSIDRLSQLPFSSLKLDQGVVKRMGTSRRNLEVVKASISMARELRMTSIAEGVESAGAYDLLIANGCEEAQGYWIARPMSLDELHGFIDSPPLFGGSQIGRVHHAILDLLHFRKCLVDAVFCSVDGTADALQSVMHPGTGGDVESSRVGAWYFGNGRKLEGFLAYRAIETPLRRLHDEGNQLLDALDESAAGVGVGGDAKLAHLDALVEKIVSLMHQLERELMVARVH